MSDVENIAESLPQVAVSTSAPRLKRAAAHLTPIWRITVNGKNVSDRIAPRFVSLVITDDRQNDGGTPPIPERWRTSRLTWSRPAARSGRAAAERAR